MRCQRRSHELEEAQRRTADFGRCSEAELRSHCAAVFNDQAANENRETHKDQSPIIAHAGKPTHPLIAIRRIESDLTDETRMTLTSGYESLFMRRIDGNEIVFASGDAESTIGRPGDRGEGAEVGSVGVEKTLGSGVDDA